jgi:ABC-type transport system substrate-binding protein
MGVPAAITILSLALLLCPAPLRAQTFNAPLSAFPPTLDPHYFDDIVSNNVTSRLFDSLLDYDKNMLLRPSIATSWTSPDGMEYTFAISPEAAFHDGSPITARDVERSLTRVIGVEPPSIMLPHLRIIEGAEQFLAGESEIISGISCPDDRTVHIRLTHPSTAFLPALAKTHTAIVPSAYGAEEYTGPTIGSGPFWLVESGPDMITMDRVESYHGPMPHIERLRFRVYAGSNIQAAIDDFTSGQLDELPVVGPVRGALSDKDGLKWVRRPGLNLSYIGFNLRSAIAANRSVRRTLASLVDQHELATKIHGGNVRPSVSLVPSGLPGGVPLSPPPPGQGSVNDTSSRLEGETLVMVLSALNTVTKADHRYLSSQWAELGVTLEIKQVSGGYSGMVGAIERGEGHLLNAYWTSDLPDPVNFLANLFHSRGAGNSFGYHNPEVDRMLEEAALITDKSRLHQFLIDIQRRIMEDQPLIPLYVQNIERVFSTRVERAYIYPLTPYTAYESIRMK